MYRYTFRLIGATYVSSDYTSMDEVVKAAKNSRASGADTVRVYCGETEVLRVQ